jgi:pyruvate,water dikinase
VREADGYVAWLDCPEGAGSERVGGKAASLARLGALGFPVPPGFAVTVDAYHEFAASAALDAALGGLATLNGRPAIAEVTAACEPIVGRLQAAQLTARAGEAIATAYGELEAKAGAGARFAVRSSGVSEDGAGASFAGLYESYLNLQGWEATKQAIEKCYRCLWQPRAVHYRTIKGMDHAKEAMGVVVMQTIPSAVSGVAFSLNPVTGARDEVLINASWGLGEAIVSGFVTPDNYIALKDGRIARKDVFEKHVQMVAIEHGTERQDVPADKANEQALSDGQITQVATTVAEIERQYGRPMDVEFAYDAGGRFYLLQARPITTR